MVNSYLELFQKKKIIRFKLLIHFYHDGENTQLKQVANEVNTNKSEVTKCVNALVEEGILEKVGYRATRLTEIGYLLASECHRKYQIAFVSLQSRFDEETSSAYAESLAMQFDDEEIIKIFSNGVSAEKITEKLTNHQKIDGREFCELIENGNFAVPFTIEPVFNPMSRMHNTFDERSLAKELADYWHGRSAGRTKRIAEKEKADEHNNASSEKKNPFVDFLEEIIKKAQSIFFRKYLEFKEEKSISMANKAFLHPAICKIENKKGCIKMHRIVITEKGMRGSVLTCKADIVRYFNGSEFIDCPFKGDDVEIPFEHFKFTRYGNCLIGKQMMQFKAECDVAEMPISIAELVIVFYPI